jgi:hypothetical protein
MSTQEQLTQSDTLNNIALQAIQMLSDKYHITKWNPYDCAEMSEAGDLEIYCGDAKLFKIFIEHHRGEWADSLNPNSLQRVALDVWKTEMKFLDSLAEMQDQDYEFFRSESTVKRFANWLEQSNRKVVANA